MTGRFIRVTALVAGLIYAAGCREPPSTRSFPLAIQARDDTGRPVGLVEARVGNRLLGRTGDDGRLSAGIAGHDGERRSLSIAPPPTHRLASPSEISFPLQFATALGGEHAGTQPIHIAVQLVPRHRRYAVLVLTDGRSDLPLRVGERLGDRTDAWGVAQVLHVGQPGQPLAVQIDTSAKPHLRPVSPSRTFHLPDHDDVLVFQQDFRVDPPGQHRRKSGRRRGGPRRLTDRR